MYQVSIYNCAKRTTQTKQFNGIPAAVAFIDEFCVNHDMYLPKDMFSRLNSFDRHFDKSIVLDRYCDGGHSENVLEITLI